MTSSQLTHPTLHFRSALPGRTVRAAALVSGVSLLALSAAWSPTAAAASAAALPTGGHFAAGAGSIATSGNNLSVNQTSTRGIINWQSFSIGKGGKVSIDNGSGATLNRVTGNDPSQIAGRLTSTGSVYVVNTAGVIVMPTGKVFTSGSFIASSRDVSDSTFMAGGTQTFQGSSNASVTNQGTISSANGNVTLIGKSVSNSGTISAANGTVALAAGDDVMLQDSANETVVVDTGTGNATNSGTIDAAQVQLAAADGNVYALATNNGGVIRATGTKTEDGHVVLTSDDGNTVVAGRVSAVNADGSGGQITATAGAAKGGALTVRGVVSASAIGVAKSGGKIVFTAENVVIKSTAGVSAKGKTTGSGGDIFVGGDRHGGSDASQDLSSTTIADAATTKIAKGAVIDASGGTSGQGGNVIAWSNQDTTFLGTILAKGGSAAGNGGFVEVSGAGLDFHGTVSTKAVHGTTGTLLLDPTDVTIFSASDNSGLPTTVTSGESSGPVYNPTTGLTNSYILNTDIDNALVSNNVTIHTGAVGDGGAGTGNVHFGTNGGTTSGSNSAPIYWSTGTTFEVDALGTIDMIGGKPGTGTNVSGATDSGAVTAANSGVLIEASGGGSVILKAGLSGTLTGTGITMPLAIQTNTGNITLESDSANTLLQITGTLTSTGGGTITTTADQVRLGVGTNYTGLISTSGEVLVQPFTAGSVLVGNNYNVGAHPDDQTQNTALINNDSISHVLAGPGVVEHGIVAGTLVIGNANVVNLTVGSPAGLNPATTNEPTTYPGIIANGANNLELVTGASGSVIQDALTPITVGSSFSGGLAVVTGGNVYLPDFNNQFGTVAVKQLSGSNGSGTGTAVVVQANTTDDNTGTLAIGAVNDIAGINAPNATVTLLNIGATTQDTSANSAIIASTLVLEGAQAGDYTSATSLQNGAVGSYTGAYLGAYTLNNIANKIGKIAASVSSLALADDQALEVAAGVSDQLGAATAGTTNIIASTTLSGISATTATGGGGTGTGVIEISAFGTFTIDASAPISSSGGSVEIEAGSPSYGTAATAAPNTGFINSDGANAITVTGGGNWRLYTQDPRNDSYGGLVGATFIQYGAANYYGDPTGTTGAGTSASPSPFSNAQSSLSGSAGTGNGILYTHQPTATESISNTFTKTYDGNASYTVTGTALTLTYSGESASTTNTITITGFNGETLVLNAQTSVPVGTIANFFSSANVNPVGSPYDVSGNFSSLSFSSGTTTVGGSTGVHVFGYGVTPTASASGTITPASLTITASDQSRTYGSLTGLQQGTGQTTGYTESGLQGTDTIGSVTLTDNAAANNVATGAGTLTGAAVASAVTGGSFLASNYTISYVAGDVDIGKAALTITANDQSRTYGSLTGLQQGTGETTGYTESGLVNGDTIGSVTLTDNAAANNVATGAGTLTGAAVASAATGGTFSTNNYSITYVAGDVDVGKATLTITASDQSRTYGSLTGLQQGTGETTGYTESGLVNGDTVGSVTLTDNAAANNVATGAGTLTGAAVASAATGGTFSTNNYTVNYVAGDVDIGKAALTITASDQSRTYGSLTGLQQGTGQTTGYTESGLVNGDTIGSVTLTDNAAANNVATGAGTLTGAAVASAATGGTFSTNNYSVTYVAGDVDVGKATLTITASDQSRTYGSLTGLQQGTGQTTGYTESGLVNGDTIGSVTLTDNAAANNVATGAGTLTGAAVASAATGGTFSTNNYTVNYVAGDVDVGKATLTITASDQSRTYGSLTGLQQGTGQTTGYTESGLVNGDTIGSITLTDNAAANNVSTGAGTLTGAAAASAATGGTFSTNNYTVNYVAGDVDIGKAALTITASDQSRTYGSLTGLQQGTGQTTGYTESGLVNGDTIGSVTLTDNAAANNVSTGAGTLTGAAAASAATGGTFSTNNYSVTYVAGDVDVGKAALTITASDQSRTYGSLTGLQQGTGQTTGYTESGLVNGDTIGSVTLTDNAAANNVATGAGTLTGAVTASAATGGTFSTNNYTVSYAQGDVDVGKATLTITASDQSRTYGSLTGLQQGTGQTTGYTESGLVNGDTIGSITLTDNAAANNVSTGAGTLTGAAAASAATGGTFSTNNYTVNYVAGDVDIGKAALTITASDQSRTYGSLTGLQQGTGQTTGYTESGLVNGDTIGSVTLTDNAAANNVSTGAGTLTGAAVASAATGGTFSTNNYTVTYAQGDVDIGKATLVITASDQSRTYGSLTGLQQGTGQTTGYTETGLVNGDTIGSVTLTDNAAANNVATGAGTLTGAAVASAATGGTFSTNNYSVSYAQGNVNIGKANLTITADNQTKVYGTTFTFDGTPSEFTTAGLVNGDTVTSATLTSNGAPSTATVAGSPYPINISAAQGSTGLTSNYNITYQTGTFTVTPASINLTEIVVTGTRVYNGTPDADGSILKITNLQNGDTVGLSGTGIATSSDVGTWALETTGTGANNHLVGLTLTGADASNYTTYGGSGTLKITPLPVIMTGTRVYDGGTDGNATILHITNAINGDTVDIVQNAGTSTVANKNVGDRAIVNFGTLSLGNNAKGDYTLVGAQGDVVITPLPIVGISTRPYNGKDPVTGGIITVTNVVPGDSVTLTGTGTSSDPNTGTHSVDPTGLTIVGGPGTDPADYTTTGGHITVDITPIPVILLGTRLYDGETDGNGDILAVTNAIGGDTVDVSGGTSTISTKNVGHDAIVNFGTLTLGNNPNGDYTLVGAKGTVIVTPLHITVTAVAGTKTYDGTTSSDGTPIVTKGKVLTVDTGDFIQTYNTPNAGSNLVLTPSGSVNDGDGGKDYIVTYDPISIGAQINPAPVTLTGTRQFDGNTDAASGILTIGSGLIGGDIVDVGSGTGTLVNPAPGNETIAQIGTLTLGGPDAGNYYIAGGTVVITQAFTPPPENPTASNTAYDNGIERIQPKQNGIVTGTIATNDGQDDQPDTQLGCTLGDSGCLQNGVGTTNNAQKPAN